MLEIKDQVDWAGIRNSLLVLLGVWIGFFLTINAFIRALNKLVVPVLGIPFGSYLAAQGSLIVLLAFLYLLLKKQERGEPLTQESQRRSSFDRAAAPNAVPRRPRLGSSMREEIAVNDPERDDHAGKPEQEHIADIVADCRLSCLVC